MVHLFPPGPGHGVAKDMCRLCLPSRRQLWEHVTGAVAADFKNEEEYWGGGPSECTNVYEGSTGWAAQHEGGVPVSQLGVTSMGAGNLGQLRFNH